MSFQTPNLHPFILTWTRVVECLPLRSRDVDPQWLADTLMEEALEAMREDDPELAARSGFVITQIDQPEPGDPAWDREEVEINFHLVCSEETARWLDDLDYAIGPAASSTINWRPAPEGMTWLELAQLIQRSLASGDIKPDDIASCTDDNDPNAPWMVFRAMLKGDNGWFFATEEFQP